MKDPIRPLDLCPRVSFNKLWKINGERKFELAYLCQLEEKGLDNEETWRTIMLAGGSVQHLTALTDEERAVFKTFKEISQLEIIQQASICQKYIDQGRV